MTPPSVDWARWLRRWDGQQALYMQDRERRFGAMFDALEANGAVARVVDLACGPGSLTQRFLRRFPNAVTTSVDFDPVLLRLGRSALARWAHRVTWVDADLRTDGWARRLPPGPYDAVLSTTALHWLSDRALRRVYRTVHGLLRPGGLFLNGDHVPFGRETPTLETIAGRVSRTRREHRAKVAESWDDWWAAFEAVPALRDEFVERNRRYPAARHHEAAFTFDQHARRLREAGFAEVGTVWQEFDDRVLVAVRRAPRSSRGPSGS